eukprot:TRINITY_DN4005_c0_g1_i1.p1 TRINITY_DN4005_c0_g1~~TRINITY_DN4005_c0_g1_i1.p1  ORF type:complete len:1074 (-),score=457.80 TRINITY_DN4005_c0_g1_i1:225-3446(-)
MTGVNSVSSNDLSPSMEAVDLEPSSSATIFHTDYKKHGDLREMLDSSKDSLKLDAMKRIISMVAKGRDMSDLFPAVVKNVASKNIEVKKLVYVYLTRYAEEQQDLALLSISTFQRALKDPNQLIRASALRVLSSIRVSVIVPIMLLAIKESAVDMSPFVRKTAAHAIPKLYSLEPEMKEELIAVLEKLLADRTTLVIGSAVMAFEEVCPDMNELIHKNYRKLVSLLVDVEEWGQIVIVNMLTRYARTQFTDPNLGQTESADAAEDEREFYENSDDDDDEEDTAEEAAKPLYKMDPDHRLLLRSTKPLLQSRNSSVVMATAQLYWHLAPKPEVQLVAKSLVRLLRGHNEVQAIVLNSIASMTIKSQGGAKMFQPYLRQFFVRGTDPSHIKILKLEILTNLANGSNISILLREFQSYITGADPASVAATIQAIGRCAATISEVTDTCLAGLVHLLSNRDPTVVSESVLEIKKLLQTQEAEHKDIIIQMAKLLDTVEEPGAKAAIVWVVGEYCERIPLYAPDVLRKMAKAFCTQEVPVKLQIVNLAVKMYLTNPAQTKLISQYVFNLAKFDQNYDLRDRARFIRAILFPQGEPGKISKHAKKIFLAPKPPPTIESKFANRDEYQLGSLSHFINARAAGYQDLPGFPEDAPDPSVRTVEVPKPADNPWKKKDNQEKKSDKSRPGPSGQTRAKFYDSDEPGHKSAAAAARSDSDSSSDSESDSSSSSSDEESSDSEPEPVKIVAAGRKKPKQAAPPSKSKAKAPTRQTKPDTDTDSETSSSDEEAKPTKVTKPSKKPNPIPTPKSNLDLLLDLEDIPPSMPTPVLTPSLGGFLSPTSTASPSLSVNIGQPMFVSTIPMELLNKVTTGGVAVNYRFTRHPHLYAPRMVGIELTFTNLSTEEIPIIKLGSKSLPSGMSLHEFPALSNIPHDQSRSVTLGIDYNDTTQAAKLDLVIGSRPYTVSISCPTGEMVRPLNMSQMAFTQEQAKLSGMNEATGRISLPSTHSDAKSVRQRIYNTANILQVPSGDTDHLLFAGQTVSGGSLVLLSLGLDTMVLTVNTEKIVLGNMLVKEIKTALEKQ